MREEKASKSPEADEGRAKRRARAGASNRPAFFVAAPRAQKIREGIAAQRILLPAVLSFSATARDICA